jgi:alkylhydroperoxidase family enzyme
MAEEQEDDDSEYNVVSDDGLSDDGEYEEEDALRGFRLFFNRVEGTQSEQSDLDAEYNFGTALEEEAAEEAAEAAAAAAAAPSVDAVVKTLKDQGVTYEQMVRLILYHDHKEYDFLDADRFTDELFGKIRIMVSNYVPVVVPDLSVVI